MSMSVIFWDFDGTLAYREGRWSGMLADLINKECPEKNIKSGDVRLYLRSGFPWHSPEQNHGKKSADEWWHDMKSVLLNALTSIGIDQPIAQKIAAQIPTAYRNPEKWTVYPDVEPCLQKLQLVGWTHYIVSNHIPELSHLVTDLGLADYFEQIISSATIGYEKPNKHIFDYALSFVENGSNVIMIGDNYHADIQGAESVGLKAIMVRKHHDDATYYSNSVAGILDIIQTI